MPKPSEAQRLALVRKLTAELHVLQERLNQTIEEACDLLAGRELSETVTSGASSPSGSASVVERSFVPGFLALPSAKAFDSNPSSGFELSPDCKMFSDYHNGTLQMLQMPSRRGGIDGRYSLIFNHADFDGSYLSLVVDARALLKDMPSGRARFGLVLDARSMPQTPLYAKCAWKVGDQWTEQRLETSSIRLTVSNLDIPAFDPARVEALDLHFIFSPHARGTIEIQRLSIALSVEIALQEAAATGVFESAA